MEDSNGFTEIWSLEQWKLKKKKKKKHCFPCQAWVNSRLPTSQVTVVVPKMTNSASQKNQP